MKLIAAILFVAAAAASPLYGNEELGEEFLPVADSVKEEDWHLIPDVNGKMHMVDIKAVDMDVEPLFNPDTDTIVRLFTRANAAAGQTVQINNNAQLDASNFNAQLPTIFHIHGWNGGGVNTGALNRNAYLQQINCNFFAVDWGAGAQTANYILARNRVTPTAQFLARFINWLNSRGLQWSSVTIIGHSLGGHLAGVTGKHTNGLVAAVIGMDSAGPLFSVDNHQDRINSGDAVYVENIITDRGRLGFEAPVADANFYPNGGRSQPGCGIDLAGACGHGIVEDFVAASINMNNHFGATRCRGLADILNNDCVSSGASRRLGGHPANDGHSPPGSVFFLTTAATHPFAHGPR